MKPIIVTRGPLPLKGYAGITLYPFIFLRPGANECVLRHELIHFQQVRKVGWLKFYASYLWQAWRKGYHGISYEIQAYAHERDTFWLDEELEAIVVGYWQ